LPTTVLRAVAIDGVRVQPKPPGRRSNREHGREREYLTPDEIDRLVTAAKKRGRYGNRDALAIYMAARHGLRVSELVSLRWAQIDFTTARLTVHRVKKGNGSTQPLSGHKMRELRKLQREQPAGTQYVFAFLAGAFHHRLEPTGPRSPTAADKMQSFSRGRARRWMTPPVRGFTTSLLLPAPLPSD
jgi:integrase